MPVFQLNTRIQFPPPELADESGLLAVGGDLSPQRLIAAYRLGIFPWYSDNDPLLWWFTTPRLVLFPTEFIIPRRLSRYARKTKFSFSCDRAFSEVIEKCASTRTNDGEETWIMPEMQEAYCILHRMGYAHSIECWDGDELVGGLYGVALDRIFFGESMFSLKSSASQFALIALVQYLQKHGYTAIDCQMTTAHLLRFGARELSGQSFQSLLLKNIQTLDPNPHWKADELAKKEYLYHLP